MSILIKDMEMPTSCLDCPFMVSRDNDDCILQGEEANGIFENWEQMKSGCPLVHVPPHGDLINRDALLNKLQALYDEREDEARYTGSKEIKVSWNDAVYQIVVAPTIIPAEEE